MLHLKLQVLVVNPEYFVFHPTLNGIILPQSKKITLHHINIHALIVFFNSFQTNIKYFNNYALSKLYLIRFTITKLRNNFLYQFWLWLWRRLSFSWQFVIMQINQSPIYKDLMTARAYIDTIARPQIYDHLLCNPY